MNKFEKIITKLTGDDASFLLAILCSVYENSKDESVKRNIDLLFNLKFGISMEEFLDGVGIDKIMEKAQQECGCENCPDDDEDEEEDEDDDELEDNEDVKEQVIGFMLKGVSKKTAEKLEKIQKQLNSSEFEDYLKHNNIEYKKLVV